LECILNQVDPQYETALEFKYRLSILLAQDGFAFLITHATSKKVLKLAHYKLNLTDIQYDEVSGWPINGSDYFELLKKADLIKQSYQQIDIAVASNRITTAPHDFLTKGNDLNIISAAYPVTPHEEILTEAVSDLGPVTATLVPLYVSDFCKIIFPDSILRSASAIFVKGVLRKHSRLIARQIFINIHHKYFEITVIHGLRLLYLNTFRYSAPSDVLYYVIFVLEQLGFVPSEESVTIMGDITEVSIIFSQLKMYCGSLNFISNPDELEYSDAFAGIAMHKYFTLFNIPICE